MIITAPGKLMLAGEYAVLGGGVAVMAAVNRRVRTHRAAREPSPFLDAAATALRDAGLVDAADAIATIAVDSSALREGAIKLGLGSSAAATVAAIAAALVATGHELDRDLVHRLAQTAHRAAQGGTGSGADVAASTYGGVIAFRAGHVAPLALPPLTWLALWIGQAADTVSLVARVQAAAPSTAALAAAAEMLAAARTSAEAIAAIEAGAEAVATLSVAAGVDLETAPVRTARAVARHAGGAVKTCGAGGGDVAIAVFPPHAEITETVRAFHRIGLVALDLAFDCRGVDIEPGGDYLR